MPCLHANTRRASPAPFTPLYPHHRRPGAATPPGSPPSRSLGRCAPSPPGRPHYRAILAQVWASCALPPGFPRPSRPGIPGVVGVWRWVGGRVGAWGGGVVWVCGAVGGLCVWVGVCFFSVAPAFGGWQPRVRLRRPAALWGDAPVIRTISGRCLSSLGDRWHVFLRLGDWARWPRLGICQPLAALAHPLAANALTVTDRVLRRSARGRKKEAPGRSPLSLLVG